MSNKIRFAAIERFRVMHPGVSGIFVENRANGAAAIDMLAKKVAGINKVNPVKSKYDRAYAASDELNATNWYLPHPQAAPWVNEFLFELSSFPRGKFDDAMSDAILFKLVVNFTSTSAAP